MSLLASVGARASLDGAVTFLFDEIHGAKRLFSFLGGNRGRLYRRKDVLLNELPAFLLGGLLGNVAEPLVTSTG